MHDGGFVVLIDGHRYRIPLDRDLMVPARGLFQILRVVAAKMGAEKTHGDLLLRTDTCCSSRQCRSIGRALHSGLSVDRGCEIDRNAKSGNEGDRDKRCQEAEVPGPAFQQGRGAMPDQWQVQYVHGSFFATRWRVVASSCREPCQSFNFGPS